MDEDLEILIAALSEVATSEAKLRDLAGKQPVVQSALDAPSDYGMISRTNREGNDLKLHNKSV